MAQEQVPAAAAPPPQALWVMELVQQGLLPLSLPTLLRARAVCRDWHAAVSPLVCSITLPWDAWAQQQPAGAHRPQAQRLLAPEADPSFWRPAAAAAAAAVAAAEAAAAADDEQPEAMDAAAAGSQQPEQPAQALRHPLEGLAAAFPCCHSVTLSGRKSPYWDASGGSPAAAAAAMAAALPLLARLTALTGGVPGSCLTLQGYMSAGEVHPLMECLGQGAGPAAGEHAGDDDEACHTGQQQPLQLLEPPPQLALCTGLRQLQLRGLEIPPPRLLRGLLTSLSGLRQFVLEASMESSLEAAHVAALGAGTQLEGLSVQVYQVQSHRLPLDPLLALTNLEDLHISYGGIFQDQRPTLLDAGAITTLRRLTRLDTSGLASPLLPHTALTALRSFRAAGLTKRLPESGLQTISGFSGAGAALQEVSLEAGRRGIAAVAADQVWRLGSLAQLTALTIALSKGALPASKSIQTLTALSGLTQLHTLSLGSGDHRLGITTDSFEALGSQFVGLRRLLLRNFAPVDGFAGLAAFSGVTALSLRPGVGTGKLLFALDVALAGLPRLSRLHLDLRSALQPEHVEALAASGCGSTLRHLSINLWSPAIGSRALLALGRLRGLESLQLLAVRASALSGPPGRAALAEGLTALKLLAVQAADEPITDQKPVELGESLQEVLVGHAAAGGAVREVRLWLGSGMEARQAELRLAGALQDVLPDCCFKTLREPERPML